MARTIIKMIRLPVRLNPNRRSVWNRIRFVMLGVGLIIGLTLTFTGLWYGLKYAALQGSAAAISVAITTDQNMLDKHKGDILAMDSQIAKATSTVDKLQHQIVSLQSQADTNAKRIEQNNKMINAQNKQLRALYRSAADDRKANRAMQDQLRNWIGSVNITAVSAKKTAEQIKQEEQKH